MVLSSRYLDVPVCKSKEKSCLEIQFWESLTIVGNSVPGVAEVAKGV